jgi:hypothetical protein
MKTKRIAASVLLLLSTSSYAMESTFIVEEPSNQCVRAKSTHSFSPLHRFLNDDFVSNLRFFHGQKQWNPALSGHFQSVLSQNFPIDSMTQFLHLLFPSPAGDYLVANQSTDIIAKTKASKFYDALTAMRADGAPDVWSLFELLFDRQLSSFAKEIIIAENNNICIESHANAVRKMAMQYQVSIKEALEHLQDDGFFHDGFLLSKEGKLFKSALKGGNPVRQRIQQTLPKKLKNLRDTLGNLSLNRHKKSKIKGELAELTQLDDTFVTKHDFQGYQIARAFVDAFADEERGAYSAGTLERIIATYMWQKAETVDDLPFLSFKPISVVPTKNFSVFDRSPLIPHEVMKQQVRPLIGNPALLQEYYDAGRYDVIWAYIYRERLMLDAKHVPIVKYRTTTVDQHSIPDCFETAMHNAVDFLCFNGGSFDPTVWKEGSDLCAFFTEFKHTTPNDPRVRSKWATLVAKKPGVLYYTPSKKMNDETNIVEAVPGIINMFKIMADVGGAIDAIWEHIMQLETLPEAGADEQLSASFQLLMTDLTDGRVVFDRVNCSATKIEDRIAGHNDFTGTFYVTAKGRLPFEWEFMRQHSIFKCDAPTQQHDESATHILSQLPLFAALGSHYAHLATRITPEISHQELTKLLMESDLRSPDLRREIMPILLELHLDLPFIKNILKAAEKEGDSYEIREIIKIFNKNINTWLDDPVKRHIAMGLVRSAPKLFVNELGSQTDLEHRVLYRSLIERFEDKTDTGAWCLAIELMQKACGLCFIHTGKDPITPYVHFFKNANGLFNISLFDKVGELFDFTGFKMLERISFHVPSSTQPNQETEETEIPQALSTDQVDGFVQKMPPSVSYVSFDNIVTIDQLSNVYAIFNKMKETRPELDTHLNINIGFSKLIELKELDLALFEWTASKITSLNNFVIANKDGTLNRSLFAELTRFNKLTYLSLSFSKWGQFIPDNTSDTTSLDVIVDQLPRSLQSVSIHNLYSVNWYEFEPFVETLATRRPGLKIDMNGSKSILEGRPRMMSLVEAGKITTN